VYTASVSYLENNLKRHRDTIDVIQGLIFLNQVLALYILKSEGYRQK